MGAAHVTQTKMRRYGFRPICGALAVFLFCGSLTCTVFAQAANGGDQTDARIAAALAGFHRFRTSRSVTDLRASSRALFSAIDQRALRTGDVGEHRRSVVAAYAQVLRQIDGLADPAFDPNELPSPCVIPPREPSGRRLPACADPNDIVDSATRARYVAAIDANSAKIERRNTQAAVSLAADETTSLLEIVLQRFRNRAPADTAALDDILRSAGLSDARRAKIHAMF